MRLSIETGHRLKLGIFGPNCSSGLATTMVPERWKADWDETVEMLQLADYRGIDFVLPVARWKGYGGVTDFEGTNFETIDWATAVLGSTERIHVFATVHAPLFHPVIAAKQMVTADHVGHGRFALNIVAGWNEDEFAMFGIEQRGHTDRYDHAQEWINAIRQMWGPLDDFDFNGKYFQLRGVRAKPKPYGGTMPFLVNAGRSPRGRAYAYHNCDGIFTGLRSSEFDEKTGIVTPDIATVSADVEDIREHAKELGRPFGIFTRAEIVCRPTQREAFEYYMYAFEENADVACLAQDLALRNILPENTPPDVYAAELRKRIRRFPVIGDPDRCASLIAQIAETGFHALGVSFINYLTELPYFCDEVLPRLERLGWRNAG
jgi:dimethylsulfone monooxygenase